MMPVPILVICASVGHPLRRLIAYYCEEPNIFRKTGPNCYFYIGNEPDMNQTVLLE